MPESNYGEANNVLGHNGQGAKMMAFKPMGERGQTVYRDVSGIAPEHMTRMQSFPRRDLSSGVDRSMPVAQRQAPRAHDCVRSEAMPEAVAKVFSRERLQFIARTLLEAALRLDPGLAQQRAQRRSSTTLQDAVPELLTPLQPGGVQYSDFDERLARRFPKRVGGDLVPPDEKNSPKGPVQSYLDKVRAEAKAAQEELDRKIARPPSPVEGGILTDPPLPIAFPPMPYGPGGTMEPPTPASLPEDPFARLEEQERRRQLAEDRKRIGEFLKPAIGPVPVYKLPVLTDPYQPGQHEPYLPPLPGIRPGADILGPWKIPGLPGTEGGVFGGGILGGAPGVVGGVYIDPLERLRIYLGGSLGPDSKYPGVEIGIHIDW